MRLLAFLLVPGIAGAAPTLELHDSDGIELVAAGSSQQTLSRTIYLNRHGGIVKPGVNNSQADSSSLVHAPTQLDGWTIDNDTWDATVDCVQEIWAPFAVAITDIDPEDTAHIEVRIGDRPSKLGMPSNVAGVAPMATDCSVVENAIVFVFPANLHDRSRRVCEVISQEVGHAYGLDHELDAADPMTYLSYSGERSFQDQSVACGESSARPCGVAGHTCSADQNTVRTLRARLGIAPETQLPGDDPSDPAGATPSGLGGLAVGCSTGGGTELPVALALWSIWLTYSRKRRKR